jgi:hypothetical protein
MGLLDGLIASVRVLRKHLSGETVMTTFRKLCAATTLLFALSLPALAGTIHTDFVPPPPPPPPSSAMAVEPNEKTVPVTETTSETDSLITEITLSVLQLLSVF